MVVIVAEAAMVVMVAVAVGVVGRARDGGRAEMDDLLGGDYCRGRDAAQPTGAKATHSHKGRRC